MSTTISGVMLRDRAPDMFADLTAATFTTERSNGVTTLTFDADLDATTADDVWWRMTSRDDADESTRRNLKALRDAEADTASPLLLALADAFLGLS